MKKKASPQVSSRLAVFVLLTALVANGFQGSAPTQAKVFDVRLSIGALVSEAAAHHGFPIGTWYIYDREGWEMGEIPYENDRRFNDSLKAILQAPNTLGTTRAVVGELSRFVDKQDHPLGQLPAADFTIIKYWDDSCKDCMPSHNNGAKALQKFLAGHPEWAVNIFYVDVNVEKRRRK